MTIATIERKKPVIITSTKDMKREQWLDFRKQGIGGSDVAAVFALSKYKSRMQLYLEKVGQWEEDDEQSEAAYWGTVMEDVVAKEFEKRFLEDTKKEIKVHRRNAMFRSPDYPYMIGNIDRRIVGENAGLECKTASEYLLYDWEGDNIPDAYMLQIQHYMFVMDYDYMYTAVLIGGNKFRWKKIDRNEEIISYLIQMLGAFWKLVEDRTPPAVDGTKASTDVLKTLYPLSDGDGIQLEQEAVTLALDFETWKAAEAEAKEKKDDCGNKLRLMLGEKAQGFLNNGGMINWKSQKEFDEERFAKEQPELYAAAKQKIDKDWIKKQVGKKTYEEYTKPGSRRFTVSLPEESA